MAVPARYPPTKPEKYLPSANVGSPCPPGVGGWGVGKPQPDNLYSSQITPPAINPAPVPTSSAVSPSFSRPASTA
ncbi:hypothetical protein GCM10008961_05310 [Deinococcus knuensis]|uniref:Uncharacterized protein n=1 Tax=Deinococcus knuensis TaxID=1837380 RepID=A0ABQ2SFC0_9DEIO|nr:hypothetical protein GCM10008961_05310 [Deinococcus knuensis]